jgi:hypothetical protein
MQKTSTFFKVFHYLLWGLFVLSTYTFSVDYIQQFPSNSRKGVGFMGHRVDIDPRPTVLKIKRLPQAEIFGNRGSSTPAFEYRTADSTP